MRELILFSSSSCHKSIRASKLFTIKPSYYAIFYNCIKVFSVLFKTSPDFSSLFLKIINVVNITEIFKVRLWIWILSFKCLFSFENNFSRSQLFDFFVMFCILSFFLKMFFLFVCWLLQTSNFLILSVDYISKFIYLYSLAHNLMKRRTFFHT